MAKTDYSAKRPEPAADERIEMTVPEAQAKERQMFDEKLRRISVEASQEAEAFRAALKAEKAKSAKLLEILHAYTTTQAIAQAQILQLLNDIMNESET